MNNWGIGLSVLALLLAGGAAYLGAEVYDARSSRLVKLDTVRADVADLELKLLDAELAVQAKRQQYISAQQVWGRVYNDVAETRITRAEKGFVELGLGTSSGLAAAEIREGNPLPSVHVFGVDGPEQSTYLGEFQLKGAEPTFASAELLHTPIDGETENWNAQTYRIRSTAPPQYNSIIRNIVTDYRIAAQALTAEQARLDEIEEQAKQAQELIDTRLAQLSGDPSKSEPEIVKIGVIEAVARENARADEAAASVATLRQTYFQKFEEVETLLQQIANLYSRLPGAGETDLQLGGYDLPALLK